MHKNNYDIIFTGGGASCRLLLYFLSEKEDFNRLRILVLETTNTIHEKTWCYWGTTSHPFQQLARKEWKQLQFEADKSSNKQSIKPFTYSCISGTDFDTFFTNQFFSKYKNVTICNQLVTAVTKSQEQFMVTTSSSTFTAPFVFNSIPGLEHNELQTPMWQHFEGWFVKTEEPCFDDTTAGLMNFNDYDGGAFSFLYVLPFSKKEALIESTFYSDELYDSSVYEDKIRRFLHAKHITDYTITKKEKGKIPLHPFKTSTSATNGIIHIGGSGGLIKPSTGYTFQRMTEDCRRIADSWEAPQIGRRKRHRRFLFYDKLLLRIISEEPSLAVAIFKQLFRNQPMHRILTFLNEDSTLLDEIRIFAGLPWAPFLSRIKFFK